VVFSDDRVAVDAGYGACRAGALDDEEHETALHGFDGVHLWHIMF
jgi:hypothetical protein